ncbi:hypothetical protein CSV80_06635 [Sporosarcina sp. P12(2017)]|uniref:hypothetical protein n=1 Tax=unclassified Sporosarcina TaxID=2647733 RepID=UPI000C16E7A0|nr:MULTISPECIES: hypothetical protein [unclassified Sporosarcina]PIC57976.1 hypothetical protein CSV81_06780 [Sporosarcina sp. P10]PIC61359.1 hypothetical protein CSV80_06635 [Sporosarcina sp. P12(2017)]
MKTRVGIVGPKDSVEIMKDIAKEFEDQMTPVCFEYKNSIETTEIVEKNQHIIDIWIFSGQTPFSLAKESSSNQLFFYLSLDGSSLTKTLLNIVYNSKNDLRNISFDMMEERDISETYRSLNISYEQCHLYEYHGVTPINQIIEFHSMLYNKGKVSVCVTSLSDVYEALTSQGIPVYRVTPTLANVRTTYTSALQQWEALNFKQSQLTVMLISIDNINKIEKPHSFSYDIHRLNLELQSAILTFTESISGSFLSIGTGTFIIFSTRGSLRNAGDQSVRLLDSLSLITDFPSNIGIGYGDSALAAEENARLALLHAQNYNSNSAFLVENDGMVKGPLNKSKSISFEFRNVDEEIGNKLKECGVSITSFNKIMSVQRNLGKHAITAADIAEWLKMTERNARRLLNNLTNAGIAKIIGQEAPATRGRPRNVYQVGLNYLSNAPE